MYGGLKQHRGDQCRSLLRFLSQGFSDWHDHHVNYERRRRPLSAPKSSLRRRSWRQPILASRPVWHHRVCGRRLLHTFFDAVTPRHIMGRGSSLQNVGLFKSMMACGNVASERDDANGDFQMLVELLLDKAGKDLAGKSTNIHDTPRPTHGGLIPGFQVYLNRGPCRIHRWLVAAAPCLALSIASRPTPMRSQTPRHGTRTASALS